MTVSRYILPLTLVLLFSTNLFAEKSAIWKPITPAELSMDKPKVEADADAEAIFWEVTLDDKNRKKLYYQHYVRVKIFTERGREKFSKFNIPYTKRIKVENVAARVIKPDGSIVELKPSDIFDREIYKTKKVKIKAKSFAVPGIEPGVIVEYQYRERLKGDSLDNERLLFQRDLPLQKVVYSVRPYKNLRLSANFYNMQKTELVKDSANKGFYTLTQTNIPAFKEEPFMPPDKAVRYWALLKYKGFGTGFNWNRFIRTNRGGYNAYTEPDKLIVKKAKELTKDASTDEGKLRILYDFVQKRIKNINFDSTANPSGKTLKFKKLENVLIKGVGYAGSIDLLFASMARAINLDPKFVYGGDRRNLFFNPNAHLSATFVHPIGISIKLNGEWKYFNPGTPYLPFGKLLWYEESVNAVLISGKGHLWKSTPLSNQEDSLTKRKGKFNLSEDGTLNGAVTVEYSGHKAINRRRSEFNESLDERIEHFKESITDRITTAEVSDITLKNFNAYEKPIVYSYKIKIPNYAKKTGKRMFFQPDVFKYNAKPVFSSATRIHPIYFNYPWSEDDEIEIELPKDLKIENSSKPRNVTEKSNFGALTFEIETDKNTNTIKYKRNFYFGGGNRILFPAKAYTSLKKLFDLFHQSDTHSISLIKK